MKTTWAGPGLTKPESTHHEILAASVRPEIRSQGFASRAATGSVELGSRVVHPVVLE